MTNNFNLFSNNFPFKSSPIVTIANETISPVLDQTVSILPAHFHLSSVLNFTNHSHLTWFLLVNSLNLHCCVLFFPGYLVYLGSYDKEYWKKEWILRSSTSLNQKYPLSLHALKCLFLLRTLSFGSSVYFSVEESWGG